MLAYTIAPALESGVFDSVIVSTDSEEIAAIARHYGAEVPFLRPAAFAGDTSPDIEWVEHTLGDAARRRGAAGTASACCGRPARSARPTRSGGRGRAVAAQDGVDSLRAVEKCTQHPGKMWVVRGERMAPLLPAPPAHSAVAQHAVSGAAAGLRPERVARDRLDAGRVRARGRSPATCIVPFITEGLRRLRHQRSARLDDWPEQLLADGAVPPAAP